MRKNCPLLNVGCIRGRCAFYSEKYQKCGILLLAETEAEWKDTVHGELQEIKKMKKDK